MKRLFLLTALLFTMITPAHAGLYTYLNSLDNPDVKASAEYNVEAAGWDVRAYEFTPAFNKNYSCVFLAGSEKGGAACYPKLVAPKQ